MDAHELEASVIMCTCARRELAHACIASVVAQRDVASDRLEMVIVDNSPSAYFRDDAAEWGHRAPFPILYVHEPAPNIARARNAGCRAARGRFIAFIDDDERAEPDWLTRLLQAAETWRSDAVYGSVLPEFDGGRPPNWDPHGSHFRRWFDLPAGTRLPEAYTNNLLLRRSTCLCDPDPFDVRYGRTGGSDTAFTSGLTRRGRRIVWCPDAVVHEFVPKKRMRMRFQLWRALIQTQIDYRIQIEREPLRRRLVVGARTSAFGLREAVCTAPRVLAAFFMSDQRAFEFWRRLFRGLGMVAWPLRIRRY